LFLFDKYVEIYYFLSRNIPINKYPVTDYILGSYKIYPSKLISCGTGIVIYEVTFDENKTKVRKHENKQMKER
jgi:hypothetical protein